MLTEETAMMEQATPQTCLACNSPDVVPGVPNPLCADCRQSLIKFPFPTWIKAFGIGVGIVVMFSLFSFFENLQTGIHMARGEKAEKEHKYLTAKNEFQEVLKKVPEHLDAKAHLLIADYYNSDVSGLSKLASDLSGKTLKDNDLLEKTDNILNLAASFFTTDSLNALFEKYKTDSLKLLPSIRNYYSKNTTDVNAGLTIASTDLDTKNYVEADTVLRKIIAGNPENLVALTLMATIKRYEKDAAGALKYLDQILEINKEFVYAISSKARVMIMMHKDDEALKLAKKADQLDNSMGYNKATLAIVYHYTNNFKERDKIVNTARASKDSSVMEYMQYVLDIINNKEHLRS